MAYLGFSLVVEYFNKKGNLVLVLLRNYLQVYSQGVVQVISKLSLVVEGPLLWYGKGLSLRKNTCEKVALVLRTRLTSHPKGVKILIGNQKMIHV